MSKLEKIFENEKSKDIEDNITLLENLDLFAYSEILVKGRKTNALIEALSKGFIKMIEYSMDEGFINLRSILRKVNRFEIHNELTQIHVEYFKNHETNFKIFSKIYQYLIDLLQLSHFLEIFDYIEGV